jgi:dTDP-4-dehydrorhamnose reductase
VRILVTGVSGQVGSALLQTLRPHGTLVPTDRAVLDLTRPAELATRLATLAPDVIVNPAAYTAVDRAEDDRDTAFAVNGESPGVMARWAAERKIPFIHFSTNYVFDGSSTRPWHEDDPTGPLNMYGSSKLAGEQAVQRAGGPHLIVRTSWLYAAQGTNFLRTIVRLAAEREELRIVADQFGAPTSAAWVAEAISRIFAGNPSDLAAKFEAAGHKINIAAGGETSWHGFAHAIVEGLKRRGAAVKTRSVVPIQTKEYRVKAPRPKNSRLDLARMVAIFQIAPVAWDILLERELDQLIALSKSSEC